MSSLMAIDEKQGEFQARTRPLLALFVLMLLVLLSRFWFFQVHKGEDYFRYAARNSFKVRETPAPRGIIFDRNLSRIADVRPSFDVVIRPDLIKRPPRGQEREPVQAGDPVDIRSIAQLLSGFLGLPPAQIEEKFYSAHGRARYKAIIVKNDVGRDEIAQIEAHRIELPGVYVQVSQKRTYPYGELFSHLVGYLGEVQKDELVRLKEKYAQQDEEDLYEIGDFIGKYGVERQFESYLKGRDGTYYVQEDASGRLINSIELESEDDAEYTRSMLSYLSERQRPAVAGNDLVLTIDLPLQQFVKEQLKGKVGSMIVMEAQSGRILAMVNNPAMDPEIFSRRISTELWKKLTEDPNHPLEDKSLRGQYPPASTYKMIPVGAALMEKVVHPLSTFYCAGSLKIGGRKFRCHKAAGHGPVDLIRALQYSCDVYFYSIGPKLGHERLATYAKAFGLGSPTGLGLNQEKGGLVPTEAWKLKSYKQPWVTGDTVSASIGQGFNLVTPLQLTRYTAALANGGKLMRPFVVERVLSYEGKVVKETLPEVAGELPVSPYALDLIHQGMYAVVQTEGGTAYSSRIKGLEYAGKTGTAQVVRQEVYDLGRKGKPHHEDHALFVAYAPYKDPEIAISVMIEHGGHGGAVAAPLAKNVIRYYFQRTGRLPTDEALAEAQAAAETSLEPGSAQADAGAED